MTFLLRRGEQQFFSTLKLGNERRSEAERRLACPLTLLVARLLPSVRRDALAASQPVLDGPRSRCDVLDVDADPALEARWGDQVPVLLAGAREASALSLPSRSCRARGGGCAARRHEVASDARNRLKFNVFRRNRGHVWRGTVAVPLSFEQTDAAHPQFLHHRAHRPRQVDAGRPLHPALRRPVGARDGGAGARLDGPRARARHHDQGADRRAAVRGARRRDLSAQSDRHARATSISPTRSRARSRPARARCWSSTPRRASRRRRSPTATRRPSRA